MVKSLTEYIKGKEVIIVGPASSLLNTGYGKFIDSFEVVVRINSTIPELVSNYAEDYGTKTSVLYHSWYGDTVKLRPSVYYEDWGVRYISTFPLSLNFHVNYGNKLKTLCDDSLVIFEDVNINIYNKIYNRLAVRPTTGYLCINDIVNKNPSKLHVCGFTFADNYTKNYPHKSSSVHNTKKRI